MTKRQYKLMTLAAVMITVGACIPANALLMVGGDEKIESDRGWPEGALPVVNLPTRISYWEGPLAEGVHFQYVCEKTEQFNEMLEAFAKIKADRLELIVNNGPYTSFADNKRIDWDMELWQRRLYDQMYNRSGSFYRPPNVPLTLDDLAGTEPNKPVPSVERPVPAPRVEVYLGGEGRIIWERVIVPHEITVIDRRPASVDKKYAGKGLLRGKVFDALTNKPIANAEVEAFMDAANDRQAVRLVAKTDAKGACEIVAPELGYYEVSVHAAGYVSVCADNFDNRRPTYQNFESPLLKPCTVKGRVMDVNGKGLGNLTVTARDFTQTTGHRYSPVEELIATTDADGRFEIKRVPPGFVSLRCWVEGLDQVNHIQEMWPAPTDAVKLVMQGTAIIKGEVIGGDGRRVKGGPGVIVKLEAAAGVKVGTWGSSGYLKEDGTFEIKGVPPDAYKLWAQPNPSSSRIEPKIELLTIEPGRVYEVILTLAEAPPRK